MELQPADLSHQAEPLERPRAQPVLPDAEVRRCFAALVGEQSHPASEEPLHVSALLGWRHRAEAHEGPPQRVFQLVVPIPAVRDVVDRMHHRRLPRPPRCSRWRQRDHWRGSLTCGSLASTRRSYLAAPRYRSAFSPFSVPNLPTCAAFRANTLQTCVHLAHVR